MAERRVLQPGEPAPWFVARCTSNERYHFDTVGGRYVVLCFLGSAREAYARALVAGFEAHRGHFDDLRACFFGISIDPADEREGRLKEKLPGYRHIWDFKRGVSAAYGAITPEGRYLPCSFLLDPALRVIAIVPIDAKQPPEHHVAAMMRLLSEQPPVAPEALAGPAAPVLVVPRVFEPEFCRELVAYYESNQADESGFMREQDGKTVLALDAQFKRRRDCAVRDERLRVECRTRLVNRLKPEIHKAFQFDATYAERYIVSCYSGTEGGFFKAHRDNTTKGTAHRRFAVTLNLNTGEYEGGGLRFPEFGQQTYVAPLGGAVVFSCSLLHEALPVTRGLRYAFLPFLYDEAGAKLREENLK